MTAPDFMPVQPVSIYDEVRAERERAQKIHGDMSMDGLRGPLSLWRMPILTEEVGEVARALLEVCFHGAELADLRYELIQVAAAATAWADAISAPVVHPKPARNEEQE